MGHTKEKKTERTPDPILALRHCLLKADKVMEKEAHKTDDGKVYAPKVSVWWEILDDKKQGDHNGTHFWDNYSFVKSYEDDSKYVIREGTRIGDLAAFMAYAYEDGADYFEDDVDVVFEDLEGAQVVASLEPRRFKEEAPTGTRTVSETLMMAEKAAQIVAEAEAEEEEDFESIPF